MLTRSFARATLPWSRFVLALGLLAALAGRAAAAPDPRELKAREDFVAGRYEAALDLFAKLYAETLHPNYLRNIGRCYQNLGQPDRAISTFRDYLRKSKDLKPDERAEIDGYIKEMQDLKKQREATAPRPEGAPTPAPVTPLPNAVTPEPAATIATAPLTASPPPEEEPSPLYAKWWFWAALAGVVGVGVGVAAAAGAFTSTTDASCPTGYRCAP